MVNKITLVGKEVSMLKEILLTCKAYYAAIGDDDNVEVEYCKHLESMLEEKENTVINNEITW
jgi:hypothetical protein